MAQRLTNETISLTSSSVPSLQLHHCVNHWGIDLCECGSGEPVDECSCSMTTPSEKLSVKRPSLGFLFRPLPCSIWEL